MPTTQFFEDGDRMQQCTRPASVPLLSRTRLGAILAILDSWKAARHERERLQFGSTNGFPRSRRAPSGIVCWAAHSGSYIARGACVHAYTT